MAAAPAPSGAQGMQVTDGYGCQLSNPTDCGVGVRASVYLTGLPRGVDFDSANGTYKIIGWKPTINSLSLNAMLDRLLAKPLGVDIVQSSIPTNTANGLNLTFGRVTTCEKSAACPNTSRTDINAYRINAFTGNVNAPDGALIETLGRLTVDVRYDVSRAGVVVDAVPGDMTFHLSSNADTGSSVTMHTNKSFTITVNAGHNDATNGLVVDARVELAQIPAGDISLSFGNVDDGGERVPRFAYCATKLLYGSTQDATVAARQTP